jgi:hypothetical protein
MIRVTVKLPRWLRRSILEYRIDQLLADMELVAEGMKNARAKITSGEEWSKKAITSLRAARAELALLTPPDELLADVIEKKEARRA